MLRDYAPIRSVIVYASVSFVLFGCASMHTPQQEYSLQAFRHCEKAAGTSQPIMLDNVTPDGRYFYKYWGANDQRLFLDCMAAYRREHSFLDWVKARGGTSSSTTAPPAVGVAALAPLPAEAPVWKIGDEWRYAYKSPSDSGTYVWTVDRVERVDGVDHYVIKAGTREIFYRVSDFASTIERVDGVIVTRFTPARTNFAWPLAADKVWEQSYRDERPVDRITTDRDATWKVESEEVVTVLAGTFRTFKIIFRNKNTGALFYEMWLAPEVKQWIKIREYLTSGIREREMMSFKVAK